MKSHSSPANSTPVGPPPTTITLSSLSRSDEDLRRSPEEGPNLSQGGSVSHTCLAYIMPLHKFSFRFFPKSRVLYAQTG